MLHFWGGRAAIDASVYPDEQEFWDDAVRIWIAEIEDLHKIGCRYVQIDDVTFPLICDPNGQEALRRRGDDPLQIVDTYAVLSRIAAGSPADVTIGMHMCRGNNRGKWMGTGGYEYVSEVVFQKVGIRNFFMDTTPGAPVASSRCGMCRRAAQCSRPGVVEDRGARIA